MTLFTKDDCVLCAQLKKQFDLSAMDVQVEVLGNNDAGALAHLAWHGLVEKARKGLPILVLDDSSALHEFRPYRKPAAGPRRPLRGSGQAFRQTGRLRVRQLRLAVVLL